MRAWRSTWRTSGWSCIRADRDDVWSRGHLCPKGTALGHLHHDPDRLRAPLVREGDTWREVTWDEAFARCDELLAPVIAEHGIEAVTAYVGNPLAHTIGLGRYIGVLIGMSGIPMIYSAGTVDQWPKNVSLAPHVRRHVEDPRARHRPHRPARRHGRQPARVPGVAARLPRRDGRDRRHPRPRRPGHRRRPPPHRHRRAGRRVAADRARHRRRAAPGGGAGAVRRGPRRRRHRRRPHRRCRRRPPPRGRLDARACGRRDRRRRRADPGPRPRAGRHAARRGLRPHRHLQPGVRHAGRAGWSTW